MSGVFQPNLKCMNRSENEIKSKFIGNDIFTVNIDSDKCLPCVPSLYWFVAFRMLKVIYFSND